MKEVSISLHFAVLTLVKINFDIQTEAQSSIAILALNLNNLSKWCRQVLNEACIYKTIFFLHRTMDSNTSLLIGIKFPDQSASGLP